MLQVPSIDFFKFAIGWVSKIFEKLIEVKKTKESDFDQVADIFGDPFDLAKYYIEPECQQFNPADDDEDEISYLVREPIFHRIESFIGGQKREGKHQLFILSDAGMGKTSVLVMLKLAHLSAFWPKGYECKLYKLGKDTIPEIQKLSGRKGIILLLDALDEDPLAWGRTKDRIVEILQETLNFKRVIITCRTQFFSADEDPFNRRGQVEVGGYLCPVIYNSLFNSEQIRQYLSLRYKDHKNSQTHIKQSQSIIEKMGSLKFRPMLLAHIEEFLESEQNDWNEYSIYETMVKVWLMREQRKKLDQNTNKASVDDLWAACRELAIHLQKSGRREMSENEILGLVNKVPSLKHIPTINITGRSLLNKNSRGYYRFSHYTIQEFLIVNASIYGAIDIKNETILPTDQMNSFVGAWLADPTISHQNIAILKEYNLSGVNMSEAIFDNLDLREINLANADLRNASFNNTQLQWAKLENADLRGANLRNAILHWANFNNAVYDQSTIWPISGIPKGAINTNNMQFFRG
jgi:hypothetical protein